MHQRNYRSNKECLSMIESIVQDASRNFLHTLTYKNVLLSCQELRKRKNLPQQIRFRGNLTGCTRNSPQFSMARDTQKRKKNCKHELTIPLYPATNSTFTHTDTKSATKFHNNLRNHSNTRLHSSAI